MFAVLLLISDEVNMIEQLLSSGGQAEEIDDHDLSFPAGTPFKGVVRSKDFINGTTLAFRIDLTAGVAINNDSGWLHFLEDNGYNIYIAKKPLRSSIGWSDISSAQTGKEITIGGKTFVVEFMSGMKGDGFAASVDNSGGAWNKYIYNIYGGERLAELPVSRENWGSYTSPMLGLPLDAEEKLSPGAFSWVKETVTNVPGGHATRGVMYPGTTSPNVAGVWYGGPPDAAIHYGWRPMLVEKGTTPPVPITPFKGEIAQADLITQTDLATALGLTDGTNINPDAPWLKIVENGVTVYLAKNSFRNNILKETLESLNIVTGGHTIVIGGLTYKVRCMTGRDAPVSGTIGGEWLDWMTKLTDGTWAAYTTTQLATGTGGVNNGELVHVQEMHNESAFATNGYPSLMGPWYQNPGATNAAYGWRPVLELVP